jgi:hypothetical protein
MMPWVEVKMRLFKKCCAAAVLIALMSVVTGVVGASPLSGGITVPVMTPLTVKLDEAVTIKTAKDGGNFTATLTRPVQVDGITVIPVGSAAAGLVHKEPQRSVELNSVFVNGRQYRVTTTPVAINQKGSISSGTTFTFNLVLSVNISK